MRILDRYLARLFLGRFLLLLAGLSALVVLLDLLANADDVINAAPSAPAGLLRYAGLRLPLIAADLLPLSALLAALLTLSFLVRHHELVAMISAGLSQGRLALALLPAALLAALPQFLLEDQAVPAATGALRAWGVGEYGAAGSARMTWLRDGAQIVRIRHIAADGRRLAGVTVFQRDGEGRLRARLRAETATHAGGVWTLRSVRTLNVADGAVTTADGLRWPSRLVPERMAILSAEPNELSFTEIRALLDNAAASRPDYVYGTWLHRRAAAPVATLLLIFLAVPLAQRFQRQGGMALPMIAGIGIGFLYFVFEGLTLTVGEAGLLPAAVAGWAPPAALALVGAAIAVQFERRRPGRAAPA